MSELAEGCEELGLALSSQQLDQLEAYAELLRKWNKSVNLISRRDMRRLIPRHLLDSLSAHQWIQGADVLDVGSGAGLPGIPLAIALDTVSFTLCERMTRRARILHQMCGALELDNVRVTSDDASALPDDQVFQTVVARAVAAPDVLWTMLADNIAPMGRLLIYSATQTDGEPNDDLAGPFEGGAVSMHRVRVPGMENTHTLCEITKI